MGKGIFDSIKLKLDCDKGIWIEDSYKNLILFKEDNIVGQRLTLRKAYDLCLSFLRTVDAGPKHSWENHDYPEFTITSNALLRLREYAIANNKPQFEDAVKRSLERLAIE